MLCQAAYLRFMTTLSGMFHQESVGDHPFVIMSALPPGFGYTKAFLDGGLQWAFDASTTASEGGGRLTNEAVRKLCVELLAATTGGEALAVRQTTLKTMFAGHYDAARSIFIAKFFLGDAVKSGINKHEAIALLVKNNIPFIPWAILKSHLELGEAQHKAGTSVAKLSCDASYKAFCKAHAFGKPAETEESLQAKSLKLAKAVAFWQEGVQTHNALVPSKQVHVTDADFANLGGSQFSFSNGGTPTPNLRMEGQLRDKLMLVHGSLKDKANEQKKIKADELQRQARELLDDVSERSPKRKKKKSKQPSSDSDSDHDTGLNALDTFMKALKRKIELAEYIDFALMSTSRLAEIKMLNASSHKKTRLQAGVIFHHSLSESDVQLFSGDLGQIFDGFLFTYLRLISESHLPLPMKTIFDRISWWQWVSSMFVGNPAANVLFIKKFMIEHHAAEWWNPAARNCHSLVVQCKEACAPATPAGLRPPATPRPPKAATGSSAIAGTATKRAATALVPYTDAQRQKISAWQIRFPAVCLSRVVRGRNCPKEKQGQVCRFTHICAWCNSASCKAMCSAAELL